MSLVTTAKNIHKYLLELLEAFPDMSKKELINNLINTRTLYIENLKKTNLVTAEFISMVASILIPLIKNKSPIDYELIVDTIVNNTIRSIKETTKLSTKVNPAEVIYYNKLIRFVNMIHLSYPLTPLMAQVFVNKEKHALSLNPNLKEGVHTTEVSFQSLSHTILQGKYITDNRYQLVNYLVGRYALKSSAKELPSGSYFRHSSGIYQRAFCSTMVKEDITLNMDLIARQATIYHLPTKMLDCILNTFMNYNLYNYRYTHKIESSKQTYAPIKLPQYTYIFTSNCQHYQDVKTMEANEFIEKYIRWDLSLAFCVLCHKEVKQYMLLDNVYRGNSKSFQLISNYKIFNNKPYSDFLAVRNYVEDYCSRIFNIAKIVANDSSSQICKFVVDILINFNDNRTMLESKYREDIKSGVFFPKITNQLFMLELYEKEQFAEKKFNSITCLFMIGLCLCNFTFLLQVLGKYSSIRKYTTIPDILVATAIRMKFELISTDVARRTIEIYLSKGVLPSEYEGMKKDLELFVHDILSKEILSIKTPSLLESVTTSIPNSDECIYAEYTPSNLPIDPTNLPLQIIKPSTTLKIDKLKLFITKLQEEYDRLKPKAEFGLSLKNLVTQDIQFVTSYYIKEVKGEYYITLNIGATFTLKLFQVESNYLLITNGNEEYNLIAYGDYLFNTDYPYNSYRIDKLINDNLFKAKKLINARYLEMIPPHLICLAIQRWSK